MFSSFIASAQIARAFVLERGVLALRWGFDVSRGYDCAVAQKEGVLNHLRIGRIAGDLADQYVDFALDALRYLGESRAAPGGFGAGARLAVSPAEFVELRVMAENLRAEALAQTARGSGAEA